MKFAIAVFIILALLALAIQPGERSTDKLARDIANVAPIPIDQVESIEDCKSGLRAGMMGGVVIVVIILLKFILGDFIMPIVSNVKNDDSCKNNLFSIGIMLALIIIAVAAVTSLGNDESKIVTGPKVVAESSTLPHPTTVVEVWVDGKRVK